MMTRRESDSIGTMDVPEKAYYGVQTLRARNNFKITGRPLHPEFIKNLARIKKAAAYTNMAAHVLDEEKGNAIVKACDEIIAGICIFWNECVDYLIGSWIYVWFSESIANSISQFLHTLPRLVIAVILICVGIRMIKGKKVQLDLEEEKKEEL